MARPAAAEVCTRSIGGYGGAALLAGLVQVRTPHVVSGDLVYRFQLAGGLVAERCPDGRPVLLHLGLVGDIGTPRPRQLLGGEARAMVRVPHVDVGARLAVLDEVFIRLDDHIDRRWEVDLGPRLRVGVLTLGVDAVFWRSGPADFPSEGRGVLVSAAVELSSVR